MWIPLKFPLLAPIPMPSKIFLFLLSLALPIAIHTLWQGSWQKNVKIPDKFFGLFQLNHSDNWEAYLAAKGVDAATRPKTKMPKLARYLTQPERNNYEMLIGIGINGSDWVFGSPIYAVWTFRLGVEFQAKYWDGKDHLILFTYNPVYDWLIERHKVVGRQEPPEEFIYKITDEGNLDSHNFFKGVELVHHYIRSKEDCLNICPQIIFFLQIIHRLRLWNKPKLRLKNGIGLGLFPPRKCSHEYLFEDNKIKNTQTKKFIYIEINLLLKVCNLSLC